MSRKRDILGPFATFLAGAAAGVILGILYAPDEGGATRKRIRNRANRLREKAKDCCDDISDRVKDIISSDRAKDVMEKTVSKVRKDFGKTRDRFVGKAMETIEDIETELDRLK